MKLLKLKKTTNFEFYSAETSSAIKLPLFLSPVSAGFPSPAEDYIERSLDLNQHLIKHPAATFYVKVQGDSMKDANLNDGDILIVDRSLEPKNNNIVVCNIDGEFTVKRFYKKNDYVVLTPANSKYNPIKISKDQQFEIFGVVTYTIHKS